MSDSSNLLQIREALSDHFNLEEIKELCFALSIDYEDLEGDVKRAKVRSLITYCDRRDLIDKLLSACQALRPHHDWEQYFAKDNEDNLEALRMYLEAVEQQTGWIRPIGLPSHLGSQKHAGQFPIETLYTQIYAYTQSLDGETITKLLAHCLRIKEPLLVEGQPGAGKTTFLRLVACCLARDCLEIPCQEGKSWQGAYLDVRDQKNPIPILLSIPDLVASFNYSDLPPSYFHKEDYLVEVLTKSAPKLGLSSKVWARMLANGEVALLLDGFDELTGQVNQEKFIQAIRATIAVWPTCPVIVTSRPINTSQLINIGFIRATIADFTTSEIAEFVGQWVTALFKSGSQTVTSSAYKQSLLNTIAQRPEVRRLARNPALLTSLCVVHHYEGGLPDGRSRLYGACLHWLLKARESIRKDRNFTDRFALHAFSRLALKMMQAKVLNLDPRTAWEYVEPVVARYFLATDDTRSRFEIAKDWLEFEAVYSGLVVIGDDRRIRFWHRTFQEYLAAVELSGLDDEMAIEQYEYEEPNCWWPIVQRYVGTQWWQETFDLLPGCLLDNGGDRRVDRLLSRILNIRSALEEHHEIQERLGNEVNELSTSAWIAGLTGRALAHAEVYDYKPDVQIDAMHRENLSIAMGIFDPNISESVELRDRIEAANALGRAGDPRLAGSWSERALPILENSSIRIGIFPVTVEEFEQFVEAGGYSIRRYWEGAWEHLKFQSPKSWERQLWTPNHPVTGVSWHEANAFCKWLSEVATFNVRLPTDKEWNLLCQWDNSDTNLHKPKGSHQESVGTSFTIPVGLNPVEKSISGHFDLRGNIVEWLDDRIFHKRKRRATSHHSKLGERKQRKAFERREWFGFRVAFEAKS